MHLQCSVTAAAWGEVAREAIFKKNRGGELSRFGSLWNLPVRTDDAFGHNALPVSSSGSFLPHFQGFQNFAATYPFKGLSPSHISPLNVSPERWETIFKKPLRTDLLRIRPARLQAPPGSALAPLPQFESSLSKIGRRFDIIQHTWVRLAQRAVGFFIFIFFWEWPVEWCEFWGCRAGREI